MKSYDTFDALWRIWQASVPACVVNEDPARLRAFLEFANCPDGKSGINLQTELQILQSVESRLTGRLLSCYWMERLPRKPGHGTLRPVRTAGLALQSLAKLDRDFLAVLHPAKLSKPKRKLEIPQNVTGNLLGEQII